MSLRPGAVVTLTVEKAVAGGRMLARHHGQVVLVAGAIPGEVVAARVERSGKGVAQAEVSTVLEPSPDRRPCRDARCGGNVLAHVAYPRQLRLKGEVILDALARVGRIRLDAPPPVAPSPEQGYRLRARLHVSGARIGFYREGTHEICPVDVTGQLSGAAEDWVAHAARVLARDRLAGLAAIEMGETVAGDRRVAHLVLEPGGRPQDFAGLAEGLAGMSAQVADGPASIVRGETTLVDTIASGDGRTVVTLRRDVRAFFQGNRFLVAPLVHEVLSRLPPGPLVDLYAGVGLFGLAHAASTEAPVVLVEGDPTSGADLAHNAAAAGNRVSVVRHSVEAWLAAPTVAAANAVIDPPRTGLSKAAVAGLLALRPATLVYVSCDPATFARDARALVDGGYTLSALVGVDLFPNTAHVEAVATFSR